MIRRHPQIAGALVAVIGLAAFYELAEDFGSSAAVLAFDSTLSAAVQSLRAPATNALMLVVTFLGGTLAVSVLTGVAAALLVRRSRTADALYVASTVAVGVVLSTFIKGLLGRPRPPLDRALIDLPSSFSFPSGHAMGSLCVAWAFGLLVLSSGWTRRQRAGLLGLAVLYAVAVGVSRVFLGVHWPSDVLASWLLGGSWLAASTGLYFGWWQARPLSRIPQPQVPILPKSAYGWVALVLAAAFFPLLFLLLALARTAGVGAPNWIAGTVAAAVPVAVIDIAAISGVVAMVTERDWSFLVVVPTVVAVAVGVYETMFLIGGLIVGG